MRFIISHVVLLSGLVVVGCAQQETPTDAANTDTPNPEATVEVATINDYCPIMGSEVAPDGGTVDWNGQTVGFCCDGCSDKWLALSEDEKKEALAKAEEEGAEHEGHDHDHGDHDHSEA